MIDELIHYCIDEIGLDGEAGTEIDRLADFIRHFHAEHSSRSQLPHQLVDASYQAFVFRQLVSHPDVNVGLFVPGVPFKSGAKSGITRKALSLDSPVVSKAESGVEAPPEYDWVQLLPDQALAEHQGLVQLQQTHGDRLRLVLRPALIRRLLVGPTDVFLPPSTYRVLQIICRSRDKPVLSTDIGETLHTDQKTVFYVCKRLVDLDLVTKIKARETGTVASYFIATRFKDQCDILNQQKNADLDADLLQPGLAGPLAQQLSVLGEQNASTYNTQGSLDEDVEAEAEDATQDASAPTITVKDEEPPGLPLTSFDGSSSSHAADPVSTSTQSLTPTFEPVDAARTALWLSSRPELVRFRIYLLCNTTASKVTVRLGLVHRINLTHGRSSKRAFITLLEHAVVDGFLEVINIHVANTGRIHRGLRMTSKGETELHDLLRGDFGDAATLQEQARAKQLNAKLQQDLSRIDPSLPRELTLERYVHEEVARAGPSGRTISQLMSQLHGTGHFARSLDQIAQRAEDADGEPAMSDLQIRSFHEHKQRVRSMKLYSHHAWVLQAANEGFLEPDDLELLASAGGPTSFHRKSTAWTAPEQVEQSLASLSKDLFTSTPRSSAKVGRPPKRPLDDDSDFNTPPPKRGRPRKHPVNPDPATPAADTPPPKKGRPRKHPVPDADSGIPAATPVKRGRPRKNALESDAATPASNTPPPQHPIDPELATPAASTPPAKRGRPRKNPLESETTTPAADTPPAKKGRPRKNPVADADAGTPAATPAKRGRPRKHPVESVEASPAGTEASASAVASSSQLETPAAQNGDHQLDSPMADTPSRTDGQKMVDLAAEDDASLAVPESPAAASAKRRTGRLARQQAPSRPTSLLATAPVVAEELAPMQTEEAAVTEPAPVSQPPPVQEPGEEVVPMQTEGEAVTEPAAASDLPSVQQPEAEQSELQGDLPAAEQVESQGDLTAEKQVESQGSLQTKQDVGTVPPSANLSRVGDLLSAPTSVKTETRTTLPATPAAKKRPQTTATPTASERKKRTNLTQLRSSNALVQCIREAGGAMDTLLIPDLLTDFVEKHGFASDAQLTNLRDRKVREASLQNAINNGLLRRTYTRLNRPSAVHSKRQIVYLPDLPAEQLQRYCEAVKDGRDGWTDSKNVKTALTNITDSVAVDMDDASHFARPWHTQEPFRLSEIPAEPVQLAMLRQPFVDVHSVYRQHVGFLQGEMLRLKAFHRACAHFIASRQSAPGHEEAPTLPLSFFWTSAPLDLYLGLVPVSYLPEALEQMVLDPRMRSTPVQDLPEELRTGLGLSSRVPTETHVALYSLATQLSHLSILKIHAAAGDAEGAETANDSKGSLSCVVELLHRIPFYNWAVEEEEKPLVEVMDVGLDADSIDRFWAKMQFHFRNRRQCLERQSQGTTAPSGAVDVPTSDAPTSVGPMSVASSFPDIEPFKTLPEELKCSAYAKRAWRPYHQLRPSQLKFLYRIDLQDLPSATQYDLERLAYVTLVPLQVVRTVLALRLERANEPVEPDGAQLRPQRTRFTWPLLLSTITLPTDVYRPPRAVRERRKKTQAEREKTGRAATLAKARELRRRRDEEFLAMLEHALTDAPDAHALKAKIETALAVIRRRYILGDATFGADAVEKAIARAIRSALGVRLMPAVHAPAVGRRKGQAARDGSDQDRDSEERDQVPEANEDEAENEDAPADFGGGRPRRDRRSRRKNEQTHFWTPARKELLRDASVILRVRDAVRGRSDWTALYQIIDSEEKTKTKSVVMAHWRYQYYRMRYLHGEEAYLDALESRWIPVYLAARQSNLLDDPDFPAAGGFDLLEQIQLLRREIDKNEVQRSLVRPVARHHLPVELSAATDFTQSWKEEFAHEPVERRFEAFYPAESGVSTKRLETLLYTPLGAETAEAAHQLNGDGVIRDRLAEWAVRIVIASATPPEPVPDSTASGLDGAASADKRMKPAVVDEMTKADFCRAVGDARIEAAMQRLLDAKLIRSLTVDPLTRRRPGTNFVFTEELQRLLPDPSAANRLAVADLRATITHRKPAFQAVCDAEHGTLVEPIEADGEAAAMVQLMEAGLLEAEIDMQPFELLRQNPALNARVLNDEDLEAPIVVRGQVGMMEALDAAVVPLPGVPEDRVLGWLTVPGGADGAVADPSPEEIERAWHQQLETTLATVDSTAAARLRDFSQRLLQSGTQGILLDSDSTLPHTDVVTLTTGALPLAFFSPLTTHPVLVASSFVRAYTLALPLRQALVQRILPHAWTTLAEPSTLCWRNLLDTVTALTLQRPGCNLAWLAARFGTTLDTKPGTQEVGVAGTSFADILSATMCLRELGVVELRTEGQSGSTETWTLHPGARRVLWAGFQ